MKNYKVNYENFSVYRHFLGISLFDDKEKLLKENGFIKDNLFNMYEKHIEGELIDNKLYASININLVLSKDYLYFGGRGERYFLPCELDEKRYSKNTIKKLKKEIKFLRENGFIK